MSTEQPDLLTPEDIKALIATEVQGLLEPIIPQLQEVIRATVTEMTVLETPKEPEAGDPLELRLKQLEDQLAERDRKLAEASFNNALGQALDQYPTQFKDVVRELVSNRYQGKTKEKDGTWYTDKGQKLDEAVSEFFNSDFGKHLLPAQPVQGAGVTPPVNPVTKTPAADIRTILSQAFT